MIGKEVYEISAEQFKLGMSSSLYAQDGGFSNQTYGFNIIGLAGMIRGNAVSDVSTNLTGTLIASCSDASGSGYNRILLDSSGAFYTYNGAVLTKRATGAKTYNTPHSDIEAFRGLAYVTSQTHLGTFNPSGFALSESVQAFSTSLAHPLCVFENQLYAGDGSSFWRVASGGGVTSVTMGLDASETIIATAVDPATGQMLVSTVIAGGSVGSADYLRIASRFNVYLWDGVSAKASRQIRTESLVTAFTVHDGDVYVGYDFNIGKWNGVGIEFIRKLGWREDDGASYTYGTNTAITKHRLVSVGKNLCAVDKFRVLVRTTTVEGKIAFFYIWKNTVNSNPFQILVPLGTYSGTGGLELGVGFDSNKFYQILLDSADGGYDAKFYSNPIYFPRPVFIRRIRIFTVGKNTSGNTRGTVGFINENGTTVSPTIAGFKSSATQYVWDFDFTSLKVSSGQVYINGTDDIPLGIYRILVYYDYAE